MQHINTEKDKKEKIEVAKKNKNKQSMIDSAIVSMHTSPEVTVYRMNCIKAIAKANVSINGLKEFNDWLDYYSKDDLSIGYTGELTRSYVKTVRNSLIEDLKTVTKHCFGEFSISLDAKPNYAEAECISLRIVSKNFDIIEVVARLAL